MNIIESPTQRVLPKRQGPIKGIIVHTTGSTDLDAILKFYNDPDGYQPHYMIEVTGTIRHIVAEDHIAWHAAHHPNELAAYQRGPAWWTHQKWVSASNTCADYGDTYPGYKSWIAKWAATAKSPLDFITGAQVNACTIGIELQQPTDDMLTPEIFLDEQYTALTELLTDIGGRNSIPIDKNHVLGHYDVSPLCRSNLNGNWDPGEKLNWSRFLPAPLVA